VAAFTAMILSAAMTFYNMMVISHFDHFVDFFWVICMSIYIFFVLEVFWGAINLILNIAVIVAIQLLDQLGFVERINKDFTSFSQINYVFNIIVAGFVFTYVLQKVLNTMKNTEKEFIIANTKLKKSNEEKTIMLKEIHHRVKNNLQVITSLLRLQLHEIDDEKARHHFTDSINRVSAMAIIHEKMYQTESLSQIDLESYLQSLIDDLISSYARLTEIETKITSNIEDIEPESIVPLALIFNELVSNTLEHGFQNRPHGVITIDVKRNNDGSTSVFYADNGKWQAPIKEYSFGLELIETFAEQLEGTCQRQTYDGTKYLFEFKGQL
jgi:two-component sensor histidine kinase